MSNTHTVKVVAGTTPLSVEARGEGKAFLLLHSGAGPASMAPLTSALAERHRVIVPTMPGFDDQMRPHWVKTIDDIASLYLALLEQMDASDVTIVGNSVGGWIAAEMALRGSPHVSAVVLIDSVGLDPTDDGGAVVDPLKLGPAVGAYAFHDPQRFATPPSEEAAARIRRNQEVLQSYAGDPYMNDPSLRGRLPGMPVRSLVLWGESDRIVTPAYGRQFADLMPDARFVPIPKAGHFPQIEATGAVVEAVEAFA